MSLLLCLKNNNYSKSGSVSAATGSVGVKSNRKENQQMANTTTQTAKPARKTESYHPRTKAITPAEYGGLQKAYDFFKEHLFKERWLPDVFITYQRKSGSYGYFSPDRFSDRIGAFGKQHELALNPDGFINQTDEQVCQTLVHEMTHVWQHVSGKPSARGYHNKEWAAKMKSIGLQPSSTGMVGGKETGQHMMDYIIPDGPFTKAFAALATTGWKLNLQSAARAGGTKAPPSKIKFTCPSCGSNMWGKPDSKDICGECKQWRKAAIAADVSYDQQAAE
jgi:SprT-like family protein